MARKVVLGFIHMRQRGFCIHCSNLLRDRIIQVLGQ